MRLCDALENKKFDQRIRDRLLAEGKISKSDLDSYLSTLEDDAENFILSDPTSSEKSQESSMDDSAESAEQTITPEFN